MPVYRLLGALAALTRVSRISTSSLRYSAPQCRINGTWAVVRLTVIVQQPYCARTGQHVISSLRLQIYHNILLWHDYFKHRLRIVAVCVDAFVRAALPQCLAVRYELSTTKCHRVHADWTQVSTVRNDCTTRLAGKKQYVQSRLSLGAVVCHWWASALVVDSLAAYDFGVSCLCLLFSCLPGQLSSWRAFLWLGRGREHLTPWSETGRVVMR